MLNSYKLLSHPTQLLKQHLVGVADIALKSHRSHGGDPELERLIHKICLAHDFGKATKFFQDYIKGGVVEDVKKAHGLLSAIFAYWLLPKECKHIGFEIVKAHHGDMKNIGEELEYDERSWIVKTQLDSLDNESIMELNNIYSYVLDGKTIEDFISYASDELNLIDILYDFEDSLKGVATTKDFFLCQYIYSLLLTGDKSQLITGEAFVPKLPYDSSIVSKYKDNLVKASLAKNPKLKESDIFAVRNEIYSEMWSVLQRVDLDKDKIFSINVPTGAGKTLLSLQASFYIAEQIREKNIDVRPSIIYTLPFTSVIDQNFDVLKGMLKEFSDEQLSDEDLLKFHSVTPIEYKDYEGYDARFCFENWQSRIVCTTFIQLFNTIFKIGDNSIANRFHKLSNSVIILDEVQVVDEGYFSIIKEFLEFISREYNVYIILVTATMPILLDTIELVPNKEHYFKRMDRIVIENHSEKWTTVEEFKNIVKNDVQDNPDKSFLIILNTVKSSKDVRAHIRDNTTRKVIYLSTEIYPKLRGAIIRNLSQAKEKYVVVSTQLVEAGVDIDMDIVYRDFAPMDSINQGAGRANRNGIGGKGLVKLYKLVDDGKLYCSRIYPRQLIRATEQILEGRNVIEEKDIFELNVEYFNKLNELKSDEKSRKLLRYAKNLEFRDFRKHFNLIENSHHKVDIIVNADEVSSSILQKLRSENGQYDKLEIKNMFRELRQYTIAVPKKDLNNINYSEIEKYGVLYVDNSEYDEESGVIRRETLIF